jgi:hypothetical protein
MSGAAKISRELTCELIDGILDFARNDVATRLF